jgi:zinc-ribbon domain
MPPSICPHCGAPVPPRAKACPECGSDEKTGWSDEAVSQGLGLPDDSFDYNEFVEEEFGPQKRGIKPRGVSWIYWLTAILLVLGMLWYFR